MSMYNKKSVEDIDVKGKKVIVRVDFNVPVDGNGVITDDKRIKGAIPTIKYLKDNGAKVVLCSHMGKPHNIFDDKVKLSKKEQAKVDALPEAEQAAATEELLAKAAKDIKKFSLKVCADRLGELLGCNVAFAEDTIGPDAQAKVAALKEGDIVLLQNTRFTKKEEKNDPEFAKKLAEFGEIFVNDAFGTAHRAHATTAGLADYLPAVSGYLIEKEISIMGKALENPDRPFVTILGGAKVADKLNVIENLLNKADTLIIGGGMAFTFLKAQGKKVGHSLVDDEKIEYCAEMLKKAEAKGVKILLPVDTTCATHFPDPIDEKLDVTVVSVDNIPDDEMGLDIGPKSAKIFADAVKSAKTVVWNGPMGVTENDALANGTIAVAEALTKTDATTIVGGGDSAAAIEKLGFADAITHISTGGGASLEFLEGKVLPGIACLQDR